MSTPTCNHGQKISCSTCSRIKMVMVTDGPGRNPVWYSSFKYNTNKHTENWIIQGMIRRATAYNFGVKVNFIMLYNNATDTELNQYHVDLR